MGDPVSQFSAVTGGIGAVAGVKKVKDWMTPKMPNMPDLPAPVENVDLESAMKQTRLRAKARKGRSSTILASKMGVINNQNKKTVLG